MSYRTLIGGTACLLTAAVVIGFVIVGAGQARPQELSWHYGSNLPLPAGDGAAFILGTKLYHAGGWGGNASQPYDVVYTTQLNEGIPASWNSAGSLPLRRFGMAVANYAGRVYLVGGYDGQNFLSRVDTFDGTNWQQAGILPQALNFPAACVMGDRLYVAGGLPGPIADVQSVPIGANGMLGTWRSEASLPMGLTTRLAVWNKCLYTVGGKDAAGQPRAEVYQATFGADNTTITAWTQVSTLPQPLALQGVAIRQGILYVLGGETTGLASSGQVYIATINGDCSLSPWATETLPGEPRRRMAAVASELGLYLIGGAFYQDTWYNLLPVPTPTPPPQLNIQKWATPIAPVDHGDTITYVITYNNPWYKAQSGIVITDQVPAGTSLVGATPVPEIIKAGKVLSWSMGTLNAGAGGAVTLIVAVSPKRTWALTSTVDTNYQLSGTLRLDSLITYTITYTMSGDPITSAVLITDTLPDYLLPLVITASSNYTYCFQGRNVTWQLEPATPLGSLDTPGNVKVTVCISEPFTSTIALNNLVILNDGYHTAVVTSQTYIEPPDPDSLIMPSCPPELPLRPTSRPTPTPDVKVANQAWIRSSQVGWQPSNLVIHFWPSDYIYLPIILKNK